MELAEPTNRNIGSYPPAFLRAIARVGRAGTPDGGRDGSEVERQFRESWQRHRYSELPGPIGAKLFELAADIGPEAAEDCLRRALRACGWREPGEAGGAGAARRAARTANQLALIAALRAEAAGHYRLAAAAAGEIGCAGELSERLERAYS